MKFALTEEQKYIQKAIREFTRGEFDEDQILELLENRDFPQNLFRKACKLDFVGVGYPEEFGGQACGMMEQVLVIEEFCRKDSSVGIALGSADAGAEIVCAWGNDAQKQKLLPGLAKGKLVSTVLFGDVDAREDGRPAALLTPAGDGTFRLNGKADFVMNAERADVFIVQAQMGADAPATGCAFALLKRNTPGVTLQALGEKLGIGVIAWHHVILQDVVVTEADIVRPADEGRGAMLDFQKIHLLRIAAMFLGIAQGSLDMALRYARQRVQFNRKIGEFQGIRHKLADMYMDLQATRALVYAAADGHLYDHGDLHDLLGVKLTAERTAMHLTDEALQIFGGSGYMIELPVEHFYRDARTLRALSGRTVFQKDVIAQAIVGHLT